MARLTETDDSALLHYNFQFSISIFYRERSVALFQALMELNVNAPEFPGYFSSQDKLATFERFWESSVPRFGEANAPGWSKAPKDKWTSGK